MIVLATGEGGGGGDSAGYRRVWGGGICTMKCTSYINV